MTIEQVGKIIEKYQGKRTALISILHEIQDRYNHLPEKALRQVASKLKIDLNDVYGVATFYKSFSLTPKGTACHVRGGPKILRELKKELNIEPGQTTADKQFSLNAVNCLGVCAIGPVMFVDGKFYGEMNPIKAKRVIEKMNSKKNGVKS
jgi:NADH:ubiquinone oxidoreductase subunit E